MILFLQNKFNKTSIGNKQNKTNSFITSKIYLIRIFGKDL